MIYFIRMKGTTYVKIGYTSRDEIELRRNELQTGCPRILEVIGLIEGDETTESDLHRQAWHHRTDGGQEWFDLSAEIVNKLMEDQRGKSTNPGAVGGASAHDVRSVFGRQLDSPAGVRKDVPDSGSAFDHARRQPVLHALLGK